MSTESASPAQAATTPVVAMFLRQHAMTIPRLYNGELTVEQFQAGWAASKEKLIADLSALDKKELLKAHAPHRGNSLQIGEEGGLR